MNFDDAILPVQKSALLSLLIYSILCGIFVLIETNSVVGSSVTALLGLIGFGAAFLYGIAPVVLYGAPIYTYYLVEPKFPFIAVLIASTLPGTGWVYFAEPRMNEVLILAAGPSIALMLHLLVTYRPVTPPQ